MAAGGGLPTGGADDGAVSMGTGTCFLSAIWGGWVVWIGIKEAENLRFVYGFSYLLHPLPSCSTPTVGDVINSDLSEIAREYYLNSTNLPCACFGWARWVRIVSLNFGYFTIYCVKKIPAVVHDVFFFLSSYNPSRLTGRTNALSLFPRGSPSSRLFCRLTLILFILSPMVISPRADPPCRNSFVYRSTPNTALVYVLYPQCRVCYCRQSIVTQCSSPSRCSLTCNASVAFRTLQASLSSSILVVMKLAGSAKL